MSGDQGEFSPACIRQSGALMEQGAVQQHTADHASTLALEFEAWQHTQTQPIERNRVSHLCLVWNWISVLSYLYFLYATGLAAILLLTEDEIDYGEYAHATFLIIALASLICNSAMHWYRGTYFPMTASDSFYVLRFRAFVDMKPPVIRATTVFTMFWLSLAYFVISGISLSEAKGFQEDFSDGLIDLWIAIQGFIALACFILRLHKIFLACVMAVIVSLCVLTLVPLALASCCIEGTHPLKLCVYGFSRDSRILGISMSFLYEIVAWFYVRL